MDQPFLQSVAPNFTNYVNTFAAGDAGAFYADKAFNLSTSTQATLTAQNLLGGPDYTKVEGGSANGGNIVDYTPRMISQLVTTGGSKPLLDANGQVVHWHASQYVVGSNYWNLFNASSVTPLATLNAAHAAQDAADAAQAAAAIAATTAANLEGQTSDLLTDAIANLSAATSAQFLAQAAYDAAYAPVQISMDTEVSTLATRDGFTVGHQAYLDADVIYQQATLDTQAAQAAFDATTAASDLAAADSNLAAATSAQLSAQAAYDIAYAPVQTLMAAEASALATRDAIDQMADPIAWDDANTIYQQAVLDRQAALDTFNATTATSDLATADSNLAAATSAQLSAQAAYDLAYAPVQTSMAAEASALATRDGFTAGHQAYLDADVIYQQAVVDAQAALATFNSSTATSDLATASTNLSLATIAKDVALSNYNDAVSASDAADIALAGANAALIDANTAEATAQAAFDASQASTTNSNIPTAGLIEGATVLKDLGILAGGQHDPQDPTNGEAFFGAINPGVAPGNSFLAYFGQFFDHGLDFIGKGGGAEPSKITIPLALDDPLYRAPNTLFPGDPGNTKITVSRADISGFDANGNAQWVNHTSPYIDQSQTYGSHAQMTALLREWVSTDGGATYHAGANLLDGATSVAWTNSWGETTNATLPTLGELNAHLIATGRDPLTWDDVLNLRNRDANGDVIDSDLVTAGIQSTNSGQSLLLDMNPHFDTSHFSQATQDALAAIGIIPDGAGNYALGGPNSLGTIINFATFEPMASSGSDPLNALAKDVLFDSVSDHYIAGDGRVNENIALTTIHHVFHEEHNFQVRNIQEAIIAQDARAVALGDSSHTVAHDWQVNTGNGVDAAGNYLTSTGAISWNESKLFDAAKLTVEMEYQHAAVDQYARTITPDIAEFVGYNSGENATVSLEYAQGAFRFGHSTMRETIDFMDPNGSITGKVMSVALEQAFLNPALFAQKGAAAIAMGMTHQQMNEVDELLTPAMNTGLLGQPLDLAAINIARGRDIGLPTLNDFRDAIGLTKYVSWADFGNNMVHPESLVNFIAAYSFDGDVAKAQAIIGLEDGSIAETDAEAMGFTVSDAIDFLSGGDLGYNHIDTWIGGLAEVHIMGGLLGETFNAVFVDQISRLMDGDRFYYLYRLNNLNMGDEIANAQLKDIVERNTGLEHLNGSVFAYADQYVDVTADGNLTAAGLQDDVANHKYAATLAANAGKGIYTTKGTNTSSNGMDIVVGGVHYIRDIRAENLSLPNVGDGTGLDGAPNTGADSNEVMIATDNNDIIYAWAGDDTVYAEGGNDVVYGGAGIDRLYGGDGNDTIYGGDSGDLIDGGAGDDVLWGESSGTAAAGLDQIIGGEGNDIIHGGIGIDKISGGAGDDVIFGEGETDAFTHGGDGNDYMDGGSGGDLLWGDDGSDLIVGGNDQDIVAGLNGDDILRPGNPSSAMGVGPDEVMGGSATDDLGQDGKGHGFDLVDLSDYSASPTGATVTFSTQQNPAGAIDVAQPFAWVGIEGAIGSRNNDTITADATIAANPVTLLDAWTDNNWLIGGSGNDQLTGGLGDDVIVGDGIRLDTLIGTYSGAYTNEFDGASHRAFGLASSAAERVIGTNGLLDVVGAEKHFTTLLQSDMYKDYELGGSTIKTVNGVAGTRQGDGGTAGASDTVVFTGNRADYAVQLITFASANDGTVTAYKVTDSVAGRDGTDVVVGVEFFKFADGTFNEAAVLNEAPVITSDGGGATAALSIAENTTAVTTVIATDANVGDVLTYSVSGTDAALFDIDANTGVLTFVNAPNFEAPVGGDNVYNVNVIVSDGIATDTQALAVTVTNVNEAATGALHISGYTTNANSASLTATNTIADPDGMTNFVQYQWQRQAANGTWSNIVGATNAALANQADTTVRVTSSYNDPFGANSFISDETAFITANNGNNTKVAGAGKDVLLGLGGNDVLTAAAGNDIVDGGLGDDRLYATVNDGNDVYIGGTNSIIGGDTYDLSLTSAGATINLTTGTSTSAQTGTDTLAGIERVSGSSGNDTITDGAGVNRLEGNNGNDTFILTADTASDDIRGGAGVDTADYSALTANLNVTLDGGNQATVTGTGTLFLGLYLFNNDQIRDIENFIGGSGNDNITGDNLNNALTGGLGNDVLRGGQGVDVLTGGLGNDTFDFNATNESGTTATTRDQITDFQGAGVAGGDVIDLAGFTGTFSFIGTAAFGANATNQVRYELDGLGNTIVQIDTDSDNGVESSIFLVGINTALIAGDFAL